MSYVPWRKNIAEIQSPVHERYRQTTDGLTTTYSQRGREFTFAKNCVNCVCGIGGGILTSNYRKINSHASKKFKSTRLTFSFTYVTLTRLIVRCFHFTGCQYRYTYLFIQTSNCTIKSTSELQNDTKILQEVLVLEIFKQLSEGP